MYEVDTQAKELKKIEHSSFSELGFKEREDLQEWIANNPSCLGEDLLIIQKEFDGFNDTNERLDLLALDKNGDIVVIENKLDDSGRDVSWQALKYVSYCSTLTNQQIVDVYQDYLNKQGIDENAQERIVEFLDIESIDELSMNSGEQRMILIAGRFRKEVTSTIMWLLNHNIKAQCFKTTIYKFDGKVMLDINQIIPVKEAEEYIIRMADKTRQEKDTVDRKQGIQKLRLEFWASLLDQYAEVSSSFQNISPSKDSWICRGSGISGIIYSFVFTTKYASVELYIGRKDREENKKVFDYLYQHKEDVQVQFGKDLSWQRMDNKKSCRVACTVQDVSINREEDRETVTAFFVEHMPKLEKAMHKSLLDAKAVLGKN